MKLIKLLNNTNWYYKSIVFNAMFKRIIPLIIQIVIFVKNKYALNI